MESICGYIERLTFYNPETGFTVAQLKAPRSQELICIVGTMPGVKPGETVRCHGHWKSHLIYGRQFEVHHFRTEAPSDILGIKKYLGSGLIKGIGPIYAARIVEKFGVETLEIIDKSPERLAEVEGLGKKRMEQIKCCWSDQRSSREVMVFLQSNGVTPTFAQKIFKTYGAQSIQKVKENPYNLARDIRGIGFRTADRIAQQMGIAVNSPARISAGIEHVLGEQSEEGHVCYPIEHFIEAAAKMLEVEPEQVQRELQQLKQEDRIELFDLRVGSEAIPYIWLKGMFVAEVGIAREVQRLRSTQSSLRSVDIPRALAWVQELLKIELAEHQQQGVSAALHEKFQILTGGPGTGKSTITRCILAVTEKLTQRICLAAPTGRAAKRLAEITGRQAKTIHSLLEFDPSKGGFKRNRFNPLECDLLVIDEASMIDTLLMYHLLRAIPSSARVLLVGDVHQLPSVGAGNVLKDMIASNILPVVTLQQIFRQAAGSRIVTNAHRINRGVMPDLNNQTEGDFFFLEMQEGEEVLKAIVGLVTERLPRKYNFKPLEDIQVLAPMRRGVIGTENLNVVLQQALNPSDSALQRVGRNYHAGDKVMQLRNNYNKEIFNGDIGRIASIDMVEQEVVVTFDERDIVYGFDELDELTLAYAISVHKYQGCECPCVVMPVHTSHFKLLCKNLLYTAVTRGKRLVVLVGTKKAVAIAVRNDDAHQRYTGLKQALQGSMQILSQL